MGIGLTISCRHCHWKDNYIVGVGMLYSSLESVLGAVHHSERESVRDLLENHEIDHDATEYGHKIFVCPKCGALRNRFYYKIFYGPGKVCESVFTCGRCRSRMAEVDSDIGYHACPRCGERGLSSEVTENWD